MLLKTNYTVSDDILQEAINQSSTDQFKYVLNQPTGDFFYDPWEIKPELKGTVWEKILDSLPTIKGEARIITLKPGTSYYCHADADDRWHLNLKSEYAFLCDIDNEKLFRLEPDGVWYTMNAGVRHTAANFGNIDRIQLVVRQLMIRSELLDPVSIKIVLKDKIPDFRYQFDNTVSLWLNNMQKQQKLTNFKFVNDEVSFLLEKSLVCKLKELVPSAFEVIDETV